MTHPISRRRAFTLVEMLVAIAVLTILLAVVFVPLRLAINSLHVGQAQTNTQNATQVTLDQMERDFARATYVFPNTALPGVTDKAPYTSNLLNTGDAAGYPYTKSIDQSDTGQPTEGVCNRINRPAPIDFKTNSIAAGDTARVDMLLARRNPTTGAPVLPPQPDDTVVTYYARRQNIAQPYDPVDNPIVLFRAEYAYRDISGAPMPAPSPPNSNNATVPPVYPASSACTGSATPALNRGALWLAHNLYGEAVLTPLVQAGNGSETIAIPRGIGLVASQSFKVSNGNTLGATEADQTPLQPDTSFQLKDTVGDGKIHQVTVTLALQTFDTNQGANQNANKQPTGQVVRQTRVFDLPNVR